MTTLTFCHRGVKHPPTAWGARLIAPDDLVHDRQDLIAVNDEARAELIAWLNGDPTGTGAIEQLVQRLRKREVRPPTDANVIALYEDDEGVILGGTNGPSGYVYVTGYLKAHINQEAPA